MMGGSVTKEGKTVAQALQQALQQLGAQKEHVDIEIISPGNRGILGIGSKPAKVKVTVKDEVLVERRLKHLLNGLDLGGTFTDMPDLTASLEEMAATGVLAVAGEPVMDSAAETQKVGTAEVKDGKLIITSPVDIDKKALIKITNKVRVTLNGLPFEEMAEASADDTLEVVTLNDEPVSSFELRLSNNKMEANLKYINRPGASYRLQDQAPANVLTLLTKVEAIVEHPPKTLEDLRDFLQEKGIVKGIDEGMLSKVIESPNGLNGFQVASGQPPVDGTDATLRFPFREGEDDECDGSYFSRNRLISVNSGDLIAVKIPKIEGRDGWTVTGETLSAKPAMECEIILKAGCELTEDGCAVISTISGRPVILESDHKITISVDPVYIVKEVSQATGNINFVGDIEVQGNVGEGCVVQAAGNIQVTGDVSRAVIRAGASVIIHKMLIGSGVTAGGRAALYASIFPVLKQIKELINKVSADAILLKAGSGAALSGKTPDDGMLIKFTIDSKFSLLPQIIQNLADVINNSSLSAHEEVLDFVSYLQQNLCGFGPARIEKIEFLSVFSNTLDHIISMVETSIGSADYIKARYVQNCSLLSSGDVIIEGQGCYISDIKAGGAVVICGKPGIARGVKIFAGGDVTVTDLGSEFESRTFVKAGDNAKISAELVRQDVLIQVGREKYRVDKAARNFIAHANNDGRLTVSGLSAE